VTTLVLTLPLDRVHSKSREGIKMILDRYETAESLIVLLTRCPSMLRASQALRISSLDFLLNRAGTEMVCSPVASPEDPLPSEVHDQIRGLLESQARTRVTFNKWLTRYYREQHEKVKLKEFNKRNEGLLTMLLSKALVFVAAAACLLHIAFVSPVLQLLGCCRGQWRVALGILFEIAVLVALAIDGSVAAFINSCFVLPAILGTLEASSVVSRLLDPSFDVQALSMKVGLAVLVVVLSLGCLVSRPAVAVR